MGNKELLRNIDNLSKLIGHIAQPLPGDGYDGLTDMYDAQPATGDPEEMWDAWRKLRHAIAEASGALSAMHDHCYRAVYNLPHPMTMEAIFGMPPRDTDGEEGA